MRASGEFPRRRIRASIIFHFLSSDIGAAVGVSVTVGGIGPSKSSLPRSIVGVVQRDKIGAA